MVRAKVKLSTHFRQFTLLLFLGKYLIFDCTTFSAKQQLIFNWSTARRTKHQTCSRDAERLARSSVQRGTGYPFGVCGSIMIALLKSNFIIIYLIQIEFKTREKQKLPLVNYL